MKAQDMLAGIDAGGFTDRFTDDPTVEPDAPGEVVPEHETEEERRERKMGHPHRRYDSDFGWQTGSGDKRIAAEEIAILAQLAWAARNPLYGYVPRWLDTAAGTWHDGWARLRDGMRPGDGSEYPVLAIVDPDGGFVTGVDAPTDDPRSYERGRDLEEAFPSENPATATIREAVLRGGDGRGVSQVRTWFGWTSAPYPGEAPSDTVIRTCRTLVDGSGTRPFPADGTAVFGIATLVEALGRNKGKVVAEPEPGAMASDPVTPSPLQATATYDPDTHRLTALSAKGHSVDVRYGFDYAEELYMWLLHDATLARPVVGAGLKAWLSDGEAAVDGTTRVWPMRRDAVDGLLSSLDGRELHHVERPWAATLEGDEDRRIPMWLSLGLRHGDPIQVTRRQWTLDPDTSEYELEETTSTETVTRADIPFPGRFQAVGPALREDDEHDSREPRTERDLSGALLTVTARNVSPFVSVSEASMHVGVSVSWTEDGWPTRYAYDHQRDGYAFVEIDALSTSREEQRDGETGSDVTMSFDAEELGDRAIKEIADSLESPVAGWRAFSASVEILGIHVKYSVHVE